MTVVTIDTREITDWDAFHDVFARTLGFPAFYGRNMDAWIDCMTSVDDPDAGMTSVTVAPGEMLTVQLARRRPLLYCPSSFKLSARVQAEVERSRYAARSAFVSASGRIAMPVLCT